MVEKEKTEGNNNNSQTPALEWLAAAIGLILVLSSIGFLLFTAIVKKDTPPDLVIISDKITQTEKGYLVQFSLENKGENNASQVTVEGKLKKGEEELETSSVTFAYAPSNSKKEGGLLFTKNPQEFKLELRALGYENP